MQTADHKVSGPAGDVVVPVPGGVVRFRPSVDDGGRHHPQELSVPVLALALKLFVLALVALVQVVVVAAPPLLFPLFVVIVVVVAVGNTPRIG